MLCKPKLNTGPNYSISSYLVDMLKSSNLRNTNAIESTQAFDNYGNHYKGVANDMDPAYMLVAIYPCSRLWNWFENQLKNETVCLLFHIDKDRFGALLYALIL